MDTPASPRAPGWIHGPATDLVTVLGPWVLAIGLVVTGLAGRRDTAFATWLVQFVVGNTTHVILTFLLLVYRRDVLRATLAQRRIVLLGSAAVFAGSLTLFHALEASSRFGMGFAMVCAALFGAHHRLSQGKGVWSLYNLRASTLGFGPPSALERSLQGLWVPVGLLLLAVSWLFVPAGPGKMFPIFTISSDVPAMLPYEVDYALAALWLAFSAVLLGSVARQSPRNVPKLLHLASHAGSIFVGLLAPVWGMIVWGSLHGLEYYFLTHRMMRGREGDSFAPPGSLLAHPVVVTLVMLSAMAPLVVVGFAQAPFANAVRNLSAGWAHEALLVVNALVLAHYFADAFLYRFRIPEVRKVALRRLGYA